MHYNRPYHYIILTVCPQTFLSLILNDMILYRKYGQKNLVDLIFLFGGFLVLLWVLTAWNVCHSTWSKVFISSVLLLCQFVYDNTDFNISMLDGFSPLSLQKWRGKEQRAELWGWRQNRLIPITLKDSIAHETVLNVIFWKCTTGSGAKCGCGRDQEAIMDSITLRMSSNTTSTSAEALKKHYHLVSNIWLVIN